MLDDTSYQLALGVYVGTALLILVCLVWWLRRRWGGGWTVTVTGLSAALLLTPAYPREGVETMAPALVVAGFQYLTAGFAAAEHALRPLAVTCTLALVAAALLWVAALRKRRPPG